MTDIEMRVVKILKENSTKKDIDESKILNNDLNDLGINSLSFIKIVVALEEEFNIQFEDTQINFELFGNVKKLASIIEKKMKNG